MNKAVLFMIFNRLNTAQKVFEQIRLAKPKRLYLASDGARENIENEKELVENVRKWVLDNIDWDCEVKTLFRDKNLGCGVAISSAVTWFFTFESDGIILEDDCVPNQSFFNYCEILLDKYKDNKKVWHISGNNPLGQSKEFNESYFFAKVAQCWGWATWADRWQNFKYDFKMDDFGLNNLYKFSKRKNVQIHWFNVLNRLKPNQTDVWDYQWVFQIVKNDGVCINPTVNMVSNVGYIGTHAYGNLNDSALNRPVFSVSEIVHPAEITMNENVINQIYKKSSKVKSFSVGKTYRYFKYILKRRNV